MYIRTNPDEQGNGLTISWTNLFGCELRQAAKACCIIAPIERYIAVIYIFSNKKRCCNHRCPDSVYSNTLLLIIYLSATETLICRREMSLTGCISFGFAQNTIHDFQNTVMNSLSLDKLSLDKCHKNGIKC